MHPFSVRSDGMKSEVKVMGNVGWVRSQRFFHKIHWRAVIGPLSNLGHARAYVAKHPTYAPLPIRAYPNKGHVN